MIDKEKSKALKELGLKEWQVFTVAGDTEYILLENVISVFSRQKAEIERLKVATEEVVSCFHRMESLYNIKCMELKVAKAEAVKEFAEKVSNTPWYRINSQGKLVVGANSETDIPLYKAEDIDNLLKETAGDTVKCDTCIYFDTDRDDQPCCNCFEGVNYEKDEGVKDEI